MVKVNAPMMSLDASGSLAGAIVFSTWKGRKYVRQLVRPSNPKTMLQVSMRAMMRFLSQAWKTLDPTPQGSWSVPAKEGNFLKFNAYIQTNQRRWREFMPPSESYPAAGTGTEPVAALTSATGGTRHVDLLFTITTLNDVWGVAIFEDTTGFTPGAANCIMILPVTETGTFTYTATEETAGLHYYNACFFTKEGVMGDAEGEVSGTVTL